MAGVFVMGLLTKQIPSVIGIKSRDPGGRTSRGKHRHRAYRPEAGLPGHLRLPSLPAGIGEM